MGHGLGAGCGFVRGLEERVSELLRLAPFSLPPSHSFGGHPLTVSERIESRMPTLDDEATDFPYAYNAAAVLIKSINLSDDEIKALVEMIDAYEPRVPPAERLGKALAELDE